MCAIIGVLGNIPTKDAFINARDLMAHRGPDDAGVYYSDRDRIALGHRRLSIIDLSESGRQPMFSPGGRYAIVFNGEIYNYREIKKELEGEYKFNTKTDTEVILASFLKWGNACLKHLDGMFVIAVWDRKNKTLFVARDRLGIKPLYYSYTGGTFYFSSEIKGILVMTGMDRKLNRQGLLDYLSYRYPLGDGTMFKNIYSLLPGYYMEVKYGAEPKFVKYWDIPLVSEKEDISEEEALNMTEKLLEKAVQSHMMSDVPIGAYLSGGIDSSLVVALMSKMSKGPVKTFSAGFKEEDFNEFKYARMVSQKFNTDHHEILLDEKDYLDLLPRVIKFKDAPLAVPNEAALYVLSKELKKHITVVISGEGADELFGGYGRIFRSGYDYERMTNIDNLNNFSEEEKKLLIANLRKKYPLMNYNSITDFFLDQYSYFNAESKKNLLNNSLFNINEKNILNKNYFQDYFTKISGLSATEQFLYLFQKIHLLGPLQRLDNATMAKSVEARVPFVDHKLVEYVSALPLKYKLAWKSDSDRDKSKLLNSDQISEKHDTTKYLLRKISEKYLPKEIIDRKKLGFPVPLNKWLGGKFTEIAKEALLSKDSKSAGLYNKKNLMDFINNIDKKNSQHGINVWMLLNIELWMREYNVSI